MSALVEAANLNAPVAKTEPTKLEKHGDIRVDPYYWLKDKNNPEVIAYLQAENQYTDALMKPTESLQKKLYDEILGRINEADVSAPGRRGAFLTTRGRRRGSSTRSIAASPWDRIARRSWSMRTNSRRGMPISV